MMKKKMLFSGALALLLAFGLVLAGCGDAEGGPGGGGGTLEVRITGYSNEAITAMTAVTVSKTVGVEEARVELTLAYEHDGNWSKLTDAYSAKWYKNNEEITSFSNSRRVITLYANDSVPANTNMWSEKYAQSVGWIKVEDGDEIKATVTFDNQAGTTGTTGVVKVTVQ
jgi:hypothetical protein